MLTNSRGIAQAVSSLVLTAEDRLCAQVSPFGTSGDQSGTGTGFSPSPSAFICQYHPTKGPLAAQLHRYIASPHRKNNNNTNIEEQKKSLTWQS
jgi:hypothetical protein